MIDLDAIFTDPLEPAPEAQLDRLVDDHHVLEADHERDAIARALEWIKSQPWTERVVGSIRIISLPGVCEQLSRFGADRASPAREVPGSCRCGSSEYCDVPIHEGQSVRRDCAGCGCFQRFVVWYGEQRDEQ